MKTTRLTFQFIVSFALISSTLADEGLESANSDGKRILPEPSNRTPLVPDTAECENSWSLTASLYWGVVADWDLHLQTPSAHIYYANKTADGFTLDRDAYPACASTPLAPEQITGKGKCGTYKVYSNLYSPCGGSPQTNFSATVTALKSIRINDVAYAAGQTFLVHDNVAFAVTAGCARTLPVTRLSQGDSRWGPDHYDHINNTIGQKGCALTSLTMAMSYAGASGITPGTVNQAAISPLVNGYVNGGGVNWGPMASTSNLRFISRRISSLGSLQAAKDFLDQALCEIQRPVVVGVFSSPTGVACTSVCHFVLVTGKQTDGKYLIADPGNGANTTLDAYGNRFETRGYVLPAGAPPIADPSVGRAAGAVTEQLSVSTGGNVSSIVANATGQRTGVDPLSGNLIEEIPNSASFVDSLSDDVTGQASTEISQSVYVEQPLNGRYEVRVTARQDGPFTVSAKIRSADGVVGTPLSINGNGIGGQTYVYSVTLSANLGNISTRGMVGNADNALIGGFIITGTQAKTVIVRGLGPSLTALGVPGALADPNIEVHDSSGALIPGAINDNWQDAATRQQIIDSGLAPASNLESALWGVINPGAYTVIVRGKNNSTGVGLFDVYDLDQTAASKLANVSTRGFVNTGDNAMIGGTIITGNAYTRTLIRALGPSLSNFGVSNALPNPTLELRDSNGGLIETNDDWRTSHEAEILAANLAPSDNRESAILQTLAPAAYTAIVRGSGNSTGVAVVEAYQLP